MILELCDKGIDRCEGKILQNASSRHLQNTFISDVSILLSQSSLQEQAGTQLRIPRSATRERYRRDVKFLEANRTSLTVATFNPEVPRALSSTRLSEIRRSRPVMSFRGSGTKRIIRASDVFAFVHPRFLRSFRARFTLPS